MELAGRTAWIHLPSDGRPRALIFVLHGGLGSAEHLASGSAETALNLDGLADEAGVGVIYLNGTRAGPRIPATFKAWNAGGCCGAPARDGVDDAGYVTHAVETLGARYGVPPGRRYAVGHSNGAMMIQRVICERGVFAAAIAISGPLQTAASACPAAAGRRILAIHGAEDPNVPIGGGRGGGVVQDTSFVSEQAAETAFRASGARYDLIVLSGTGHRMAEIDHALGPAGGLAGYVRSTFGLAAGSEPAR